MLLLAAGACGGGSSGPTATASGKASPSAPTPTRPPDCGPGFSTGTPPPGAGWLGIIGKLQLGGGEGVVNKGDDVKMTMSLTNCGDNAANLRFPTSQRYVFIIQRADTLEEVWRSADGKSFAQVVGEETLQPSETVRYTETWDQKTSKGEQVAPGAYKVLAFSVGCPTASTSDCQFGPVGGLQIKE